MLLTSHLLGYPKPTLRAQKPPLCKGRGTASADARIASQQCRYIHKRREKLQATSSLGILKTCKPYCSRYKVLSIFFAIPSFSYCSEPSNSTISFASAQQKSTIYYRESFAARILWNMCVTTNVVLPLSYFYAKLWYLPQEIYCVYNPLDNPPVKNQRFLPALFAQGAFLDCTTSKKKNRVFITQVRYEHSTCLPGTKKWPALKAHPAKSWHRTEAL